MLGTSRDFLHCHKTQKSGFKVRTKPSKPSWLESFLPSPFSYKMFALAPTVLWAGESKHTTHSPPFQDAQSPAPDCRLTTSEGSPSSELVLVHSSNACASLLRARPHARQPTGGPSSLQERKQARKYSSSATLLYKQKTHTCFLVLKTTTEALCSQTM